MPNITLSVSKELKKEMERFPEMNWSEIARQAIRQKTVQLSVLKSITSKSKFTEKDAIALGRKINKGLAKKYEKLV